MRLLRLGNSYDNDPNVPREANKASVADRILADGSGEEVETTIRTIWPQETLPRLIDDWLDRYEPDIALLVVSSYWFTYVSVPVRMERRFGRAGKRLSRWGLRAAGTPWLAHNRPFRLMRRAAIGAIGGETNFTPEQVIDSMQTCIRRIVARESIALAVRGPRVPFAADGTEKTRRWAEQRRSFVDRSMADFCRQLHVEYIGYDVGESPMDRPETFQGDLVHSTASAHEEQGTREGEALLRAWLTLHPHNEGSAVPAERL